MKTTFNRLFGYGRFSTLEQNQGDSFSRQSKGYQFACKHFDKPEAGFYFDAGISGFKGKNKLRQFGNLLNTIQEWDCIWCENIDRLGREETIKSLAFYQSLVFQRNIQLLIGNDLITKENFNDKLAPLFFQAYLASGESLKKSERITNAWQSKKTDALKGIPTVQNCLPKWLSNDLKTAGKFIVNEPMAKAIRDMFKKYLTLGICRLTDYMNQHHKDACPTDKGWQMTTIQKYLSWRAVLGELTTVEPSVPDYLPRIVDEVDFYKAQDAGKRRKNNTGNKTSAPSKENFLSGLLKCRYCGGGIQILSKWDNATAKQHYLICGNGRQGTCKCKSNMILRETFEDTVIMGLAFPISQMRPKPTAEDITPKIEAEIKTLTGRIAKLVRLDVEAPEIADEIKRLTTDRKALQTQLEDEKGKQAVSGGSVNVWVDMLAKCQEYRTLKSSPQYRLELKELFPAIFDKILVDVVNKSFQPVWKSYQPKPNEHRFDKVLWVNSKAKTFGRSDDWNKQPENFYPTADFIGHWR